MDCHILRLLHVDFNPFRLRAWYSKAKQERRWVELSGKMIQIKMSRVKRRVQVPHAPPRPYNLPLRFEHLREPMGTFRTPREKAYQLTDIRSVVRSFKKRRNWGVLERRLKEIIAAVLFAALLLLLT